MENGNGFAMSDEKLTCNGNDWRKCEKGNVGCFPLFVVARLGGLGQL